MSDTFLLQPPGTFDAPNSSGGGTGGMNFDPNSLFSNLGSIVAPFLQFGASIYNTNHQNTGTAISDPFGTSGSQGQQQGQGTTPQTAPIPWATIAIWGFVLILIVVVLFIAFKTPTAA